MNFHLLLASDPVAGGLGLALGLLALAVERVAFRPRGEPRP